LVVLSDPLANRVALDDYPALRSGRRTPRVDAAVSARSKTTEGILAAISQRVGRRRDAVLDRSSPQSAAAREPRLTLIVDAIDEAAEPIGVALELARLAHEQSVVVVATRKHSDILDALHPSCVVDLDSERDHGDVEIVVLDLLLRRPDSPYKEAEHAATRAARAVADQAGGNFLFARLAAEALIQRALEDPSQLEWRGELFQSIPRAMDAMLGALGPDRRQAEQLLAALAFAPAGLSEDAWLAEANALGADELDLKDLRQLLVSPAAGLVYASGAKPQTYRIAHVALSESLATLWTRHRAQDEEP
jgi:hypothetical protein